MSEEVIPTYLVVRDPQLISEDKATDDDIIYCYSKAHADAVANDRLSAGWTKVAIIRVC